LEAFEDFAGLGIARRDGATGAGIAALEIYFTNFEADYAAFVFAEELVFPEGGDAVDFERGAETLAGFVERDAGIAFRACGKPTRNGFERGGRDYGGTAGDGVVREPIIGVTDNDLLVEEDAEPFCGLLVGFGEGESARGDFAAVAGDGEGDFAKIRGVVGADEMDGGSALAVDPFAVDRVEGPGAVEGEAAGGADEGFGDGEWVEGFDGVETDVDQVRGRLRRGHGESLAEEGSYRRKGINAEDAESAEFAEEERREAIVTASRVWLKVCHGPSTAARKRRGPPVGMTEVMLPRILMVWVAWVTRQERRQSLRTPKKRGARRDTLLVVSGCAPRRRVHCGENLSGRNQRR